MNAPVAPIGAMHMAMRIQNGILSATDLAVEKGLRPRDAAKAIRVLIHIGLMRIDPVDGQFYVRHGAVWDRATLDRCAGEMGDEALKKTATPWRKRR